MSTTKPVGQRPSVSQYPPTDAPYPSESRGAGWVLFAGVMLAMLATLNVIDGIAAVSSSTFFVNDAEFILSDLNTWGWVLIAIGVVQGLAAIGVWAKVPVAIWLGVTIAGLNAIAQMFFLPAYPLWSLAMVTLDILVIYGLVVYGARTRRTRDDDMRAPQASAFTLEYSAAGPGAQVATAGGVVALYEARELERGVIAGIRQGRTRVVLDLHGVTEVGAGLLGVLLRIRRGVTQVDGRLAMVVAGPQSQTSCERRFWPR
jgi:hypothetical protein